MGECDHLREGSRLREICEGTADLPLERINAWRAERWNLPPLTEGGNGEEVAKGKRKPIKVRQSKAAKRLELPCPHRGGEVGTIECKPCQGGPQPIFACALHGQCVKMPNNETRRQGVQDCFNCADLPEEPQKKRPKPVTPNRRPKIVPDAGPVVARVEWGEQITKHLIYHVWPVKRFGAWQWNLDQLLNGIDQFNGRRIVAIATSKETDSADRVMEYLAGHGIEFLTFKNNPTLREVVSFVPMLDKLQTDSTDEVAFFGHAKGVRHRIGVDCAASTVIRWASAMYEATYRNWDAAKEIMTDKAMAGSFKRTGQFTTPGNWKWHYSGTFYWMRLCHVFNRNWRRIDSKFFGVESWPGLMFRPEDSGCLFMDRAGDLYNLDYWNKSIQPALERWRDR